MKHFLHILGTIWLLPATILVWLFYIFPLWATNHILIDGWADFLIPKFVINKAKNDWYTRAWRDWGGWSGPNVLITKEDVEDDLRYHRTLLHEVRHCKQQWVFGIFHYPIYFMWSIGIWFVNDGKHAYLDNPFERDARKAADQMVDIPREQWMHGPDDRWPWW